jgi:hypothetical protein
MSEIAVGVAPRRELDARPRLWRALESVHDVRFCGVQPGAVEGLAGLILVGADVAESAGELPVLHMLGDEPAESARGEVSFGTAAPLDRRLRGAVLWEERCHDLPPVEAGDGRVLASVAGRAVWTAQRGGWRQRAAAMPGELEAAEVLRDRFTAERFFALLPILELLRRAGSQSAWRPPPLRAAFVLDDPNLHWPVYGFADFAALATAGERDDFHVAVAAVPLDMWFSHPAAVRRFQHERLSLLVHGNDHVRCELARDLPEREQLAVAAQAQRRVARLERRTGLPVARVIAPPHGECSQAMLRALRRSGFDAACISRPFPWLQRPPAHALSAQWQLADIGEGCVPVISRHPIGGVAQDVYLRAYLDQPIVLYGHHWDLRDGLQPLMELARLVNSLGDVEWMGLGEIAAGNYLTRRHGDELHVRLFTRRAELAPADGAAHLIVEHGRAREDQDLVEVRRGGSAPQRVELGEAFATPPGTGPLSLRLIARDAVDVSDQRPPAWSAWARARRALVEARDRAQPAASRLRSVPGRRRAR